MAFFMNNMLIGSGGGKAGWLTDEYTITVGNYDNYFGYDPQGSVGPPFGSLSPMDPTVFTFFWFPAGVNTILTIMATAPGTIRINGNDYPLPPYAPGVWMYQALTPNSFPTSGTLDFTVLPP